MCGIAGIAFSEAASAGACIERMTGVLHHRGPDGTGFIALSPGALQPPVPLDQPPASLAKVFLGHRRLSIIDVEGSKQPLANEDGSVWVSFNGEIYNYIELRQELRSRGHSLREAGDTEVLVHLWEEYGENCVDHLVGMFAFAIYDTRQDILFLARDRFGQKPLFYWRTDDRLAFASELQALWELEDFPAEEIDDIAAAQYFRYGYVPGPRTIYAGVNSLPAGHTATWRDGNLNLRSYWRPRVRGTGALDLEELEHYVDQSVKIRLRSDVPLGAFLSGGIDSSLIVASMARQTSQPVQTFTISLGDSRLDESQAAEATAAALGTRHRRFQVEPDLVSVAEKLAGHYGQPFADFSSVPTYYVSRETRRHVTVALTGDGGDELFAGYLRYSNFRWTRLLSILPMPVRAAMAGLAKQVCVHSRRLADVPLDDFIVSAGKMSEKGDNITNLFHRGHRKNIFTERLMHAAHEEHEEEVARFGQLFSAASSEIPLERWLEVDQQLYLCDDILAKVDIASMAVSLECRAPLLDHRLAEAVNRIPLKEKIAGNATKIPLRALAKRQLPGHLLNLPKRGFTLPLAAWLRHDLRDWASAVIFDNTANWAPFLREDRVEKMWNEHQGGHIDHAQRLWTIIAWNLSFRAIHRQWRRAAKYEGSGQ
jgi:asparagine synthase (glutamine-hydrolysing)